MTSAVASLASISVPASELVAKAKAIAAAIEAEAPEAERIGHITPRCVELLKQANLFWMFVPTELGGSAADPWTAIEVIEEITRAHGSAGWVLMANAAATGLAVSYCGDGAIDTLFKTEKPIFCGMSLPGGKANVVDGGFTASGSYRFGSGASHATWFFTGVTVFENGEQRMLPSGAPELRVCFAPRDTITLLDNWDVVGMFATGSYDYEVAEQFFPIDMSMERSVTVPRRGGSLFNIGLIGIAYLGHAAIALGLMKRSLEEVADIAATKTRAGYTGTFSNDPVFRREFAIMEAQYQAARSYVRDVFDDAYASAQAGTPITAEQRGRFKQSTVWAHDIGMKVVQFCNTWGGSQALRNPSVLGRCLRDMSVATQHIFVDQNHYTDAGTALVEAYVGRNAAVAAKP